MGWLLADVNADSAIRVGDEPFELGCVDRSCVHVEAARASVEGLDWRIKSIDRSEVYKAYAAGASDVIFPYRRPRRRYRYRQSGLKMSLTRTCIFACSKVSAVSSRITAMVLRSAPPGAVCTLSIEARSCAAFT